MIITLLGAVARLAVEFVDAIIITLIISVACLIYFDTAKNAPSSPTITIPQVTETN